MPGAIPDASPSDPDRGSVAQRWVSGSGLHPLPVSACPQAALPLPSSQLILPSSHFPSAQHGGGLPAGLHLLDWCRCALQHVCNSSGLTQTTCVSLEVLRILPLVILPKQARVFRYESLEPGRSQALQGLGSELVQDTFSFILVEGLAVERK